MLTMADTILEVAKSLKKYGKQTTVVDPVRTASMPNVESMLYPYILRSWSPPPEQSFCQQ